MTDPVLICEGLSHVYRTGFKALTDANLTVSPGEVVGVIGQNGSGKTTLVKHFNGLLKPTDGRVVAGGMDTREHTVQKLSRFVGYAFQNPNHQLFAKSVEEELAFGPTNLGIPQEQVSSQVEAAMEFFHLQPFRKQHPYRLSYPLRKLVGIASIFTMNPKVMVLDEPTTGQDHAGVRLIRDLIGRLQKRDFTVIVVSHDMNLIAEACGRAMVLWQSRIIADGTPRSIFGNPEIMERTRLQPPQVTRLAERVHVLGMPDPVLTVDEAVPALASLLGHS